MSGSNVAPLFSNASRMKLKINGQDVAYAIGFNMNLTINIEPVYVIGQYKPVSLEPTMYNLVTGTIQIQQLVPGQYNTTTVANAGVQDLYSKNTAITPGTVPLVANTTNDSQVQAGNVSTTVSGINDSNSITGLANLSSHLDPDQVLASSTFDMEVYMKVPVLPTSPISGSGVLIGALDGNNAAQIVEARFLTIYNCRLSGRNTNVALGQIVNEPVNFQGIFATHAVNDTDLISLGADIADIQS